MVIGNAVLLACEADGLRWPVIGSRRRLLAPVANKPLLFHTLERLRAAGVRRTALVVDEASGPPVREAVGDGSPWGLEVDFVEGDGSAHLLSIVSAAAGRLGPPPYVVQHGDVVTHEPLESLHRHFETASLDALVLRHRPAVRRKGAMPTSYILGVRPAEAMSRTAAEGSARGLEGFLARLRDDGARIEERRVEASWVCGTDQSALLDANRFFLDHLEPDGAHGHVVRSRVHGRVQVDPSARIHDSVVLGPAIIGPDVELRHAYVGPYSAIGAGVHMEGAEVENSIVLAGAVLRSLPARVEGSLIGRGATVERAFALPRAMRLWVGDEAEVSLP